MIYPTEIGNRLSIEAIDVRGDLDRTLLDMVQNRPSDLSDKCVGYLVHGAARRLRLIAHCLTSIFLKFPPSLKHPLPRDVLDDVQVAHHAFVINLYGFFENLAWAFVIRHGLEDEIGGRKNIGLFLKSTRKFLPNNLRLYLSSQAMVSWHDEYLKNYRDALAHRVPLYIPPSAVTESHLKNIEHLQVSQFSAFRDFDFDLADEIGGCINSTGYPCFVFLHSFGDGDPRPIYLHPQLLCDAKTVVDFTACFLTNWHERA